MIIAAHWLKVFDSSGSAWIDSDKKKFELTLSALKDIPIKNIVVIGNLPMFEIDQARVAMKIYNHGEVGRTFYKFKPISAVIDKKIGDFAKENSVMFASPIELLRNSEGCLISTSKSSLNYLAWDRAHLTEEGSVLLVDKIFKLLPIKILIHFTPLPSRFYSLSEVSVK
ncbi:MAG: Dolichol-phosphate mannosyl-transferase [uncultured bacterium]|nr:MAG: Dolichol-phosphate mannosyl-transferase [uncultured bacterium]